MKNKVIVFIGLILLLLISQFNTVKAQETKSIIYLYNSYAQLENNEIKNLENRDINIKYIDVNKLDNMKYYYLYQASYNIPVNSKELPIILSGDKYYLLNNDLNEYIEDIDINSTKPIPDYTNVSIKLAVYFYSTTCSGCKKVEKADVIGKLEDNGVKVIKVDVGNNENSNLFINYGNEYDYEARGILKFFDSNPSTPMIFAGDDYYQGADNIIDNIDNITLSAANSLKEVEFSYIDINKYDNVVLVFMVLVAGLIDGVNPCAIAMLILFISLLIGASSKKSVVINVAFAYIFGLFITYLALGLFLVEFLQNIDIDNITLFINLFIIIFSIIVFTLNFHDFIVSRKEEYGKIKNQLPRGIQNFNKKLIKLFSDSLNNKNIIVVYIICFALGVIISFTEFLCTGQVYLPTILAVAHHPRISELTGLLVLILYNVMFVLPLIILSLVVIRTQSAMGASNFVREKMHIIKLVTSIFFLLMAVYYILIVFGVI